MPEWIPIRGKIRGNSEDSSRRSRILLTKEMDSRAISDACRFPENKVLVVFRSHAQVNMKNYWGSWSICTLEKEVFFLRHQLQWKNRPRNRTVSISAIVVDQLLKNSLGGPSLGGPNFSNFHNLLISFACFSKYASKE